MNNPKRVEYRVVRPDGTLVWEMRRIEGDDDELKFDAKVDGSLRLGYLPDHWTPPPWRIERRGEGESEWTLVCERAASPE